MAAQSLLGAGNLRVSPIHRLVVVQRRPAKHAWPYLKSKPSLSICYVLFL